MLITIHTNNHNESIEVFELCSVSKLNEYSFSKQIDNGIEIEINTLDELLNVPRVIDFSQKYIIKENENEDA
jgi:hypothetical protein